MKKRRQEALLEVIERYEIDTQDELITRLRDHGYDVTQATVSRDIRELKITKVPTESGSYRYVRPDSKNHPQKNATQMKMSTTLLDSILSVDYANNLVVLRTMAGLANAVAVAIDHMHMPEVLGCVAGDDTILIVARSENAAAQLTEQIKGLSH